MYFNNHSDDIWTRLETIKPPRDQSGQLIACISYAAYGLSHIILFLSNAMLIILFYVFKLNSGFSNKIVVSQKCPTVIPVKADFNKIGGCHELGSRDQNAWSISKSRDGFNIKKLIV